MKNIFDKIQVFDSSDTNVKKFVFERYDRPIAVEAVLYRYNSYKERTVICCSTQCGCPIGCSFCGTGKFFVRNLSTHEIVSQVDSVLSVIDCDTKDIKKFQIMFMSMGEPFLNYYNVSKAIRELHSNYPNAQLLISTSGPTNLYAHMSDFIKLSKEIDKVGLQFSVHESTDEARHKRITNNTGTLRQMATAGEFWSANVGRRPFYNYCVHEGNNSVEDAERLASMFDPRIWETTLSVICEKSESVKNSIDRQLKIISDFSALMLENGASIRVFNPSGQDDIGGGCGQLWYFQKWLSKVKEE